jgi:DNA-binding NarL/FixJ family response regulator
MKKQIFIVDGHPLMRKGYAAIIGREADLAVCGAAACAEEALERIPGCRPDMLICDISLGGMSGLELVRRLLAQLPGLPVLFVSMHDESTHAERAFAAGGQGYLMKSEANTKIVDAIQRVLAGGQWVSDAMAGVIVPRPMESAR